VSEKLPHTKGESFCVGYGFLSNVYYSSFPGDKAAKRETNNSPSGTEDKNAPSYTSTSPTRLYGVVLH